MLRLKLNRSAEWVDLAPGLRVQVEPVTSSTVAIARGLIDVREGADLDEIEVAVGIAIAKVAVVAWEGVGDEAGNPLDVSVDGVAALLELPPVWRVWKEAILMPAFTLDAEKNGLAVSPSGSSGEAANIAAAANASVTTAHAASIAPKVSKARKSGT